VLVFLKFFCFVLFCLFVCLLFLFSFFFFFLLYLLFSVGYIISLCRSGLILWEGFFMLVDGFQRILFDFLQYLPYNNHFIVVVIFIATDFSWSFFSICHHLVLPWKDSACLWFSWDYQ
jgi:hypothetical protein